MSGKKSFIILSNREDLEKYLYECELNVNRLISYNIKGVKLDLINLTNHVITWDNDLILEIENIKVYAIDPESKEMINCYFTHQNCQVMVSLLEDSLILYVRDINQTTIEKVILTKDTNDQWCIIDSDLVKLIKHERELNM